MAQMSMSATTAAMNSPSAAIKHTTRDAAPTEERCHIPLNALRHALYSETSIKKRFYKSSK